MNHIITMTRYPMFVVTERQKSWNLRKLNSGYGDNLYELQESLRMSRKNQRRAGKGSWYAFWAAFNCNMRWG